MTRKEMTRRQVEKLQYVAFEMMCDAQSEDDFEDAFDLWGELAETLEKLEEGEA